MSTHVAAPATSAVDELHERVDVRAAAEAALHADASERDHGDVALLFRPWRAATPSGDIGRNTAPNGMPARPCREALLGAISHDSFTYSSSGCMELSKAGGGGAEALRFAVWPIYAGVTEDPKPPVSEL